MERDNSFVNMTRCQQRGRGLVGTGDRSRSSKYRDKKK
jgi:hypothetical protein